MLRFLSLGSGSSGNCYYLGTERYAILIDAGIPGRDIQRVQRAFGLEEVPIRALLITHDHTDHIRGASMMTKVTGCPVYTTREVHEGMDKNYGLQKKVPKECRKNLEREVPFDLPLTGFRVTPFPVPHDSRDNVGYYIDWREDGHEEHFCLITDAGQLTPEIVKYATLADHLVIESNYDTEMLVGGSYPNHLKQRIMDKGGHLSNDECATLLRQTWHEGLRHVFLCHLSADNNTPELAYKAASEALSTAGATVGYDGVTLATLPRWNPGKKDSLSSAGPSQIYVLDRV